MSYESEDKMVSHPDHYKSGKFEVIDIIDEFTKDLSGTEAVCTANAIKYILRWKKKNGKQDINKAIWYLMHLVEHLEDVDLAKATEKEWGIQPDEFVDDALNHIPKKEVDMDKITNRLTFIDIKEEIHSCDDCASKYDNPGSYPCIDCDLSSNPPSAWVARN